MPTTDPLLQRLAATLDLHDPTPVWHQIVAVIRWEVAEGRLPIGTELPPIRTVARAVGLHYHTVRRSWAALADEGVLAQRQGRGARIVRATTAAGGWTPTTPSPGTGESPRVWVVASSLDLGARMAARLVARWRVTAVPYPAEAVAPPPGPILTLDGQALERWPAREGDIHPIEPTIDSATVQVIRRNAQLLGVDQVMVVALTGDSARQVGELLRQLPRVGLRAQRLEGEGGDAAVAAAGQQLILHFPAAWQRLDWEARMHPRVMAVEFDWAPGPLARLATRLGWVARAD